MSKAGKSNRGPRIEQQSARHEQTLQTAFSAHQQGNLAEAERGYAQYLEASPGSVDALHNLGLVRYQMGRPADALGPLTEAATRKTADVGLALALGYVQRDLGAFKEAGESLARAIEIGGAEVDAHYALGTVRHEEKNLEAAMQCYQQVLNLEPRHAGAWNSLGTAHLDQDSFEPALRCFDEALAVQPGHLGALSNRGQVLGWLERLDEALESLDRVLSLHYDFPEAHNNRATILRKLGRRDEAAEACREAVRLRPGYAGALFKLGCIRSEQGRLAPAAQAFRECLLHDAEHVAAHIELTTVLIESGQVQEGRAMAERSVAMAPDDPGAYLNLGTALAAQGDKAGARERFEQALAIEPCLPAAWLELSRMKRFTEADEDVIEAVEQLPEQGMLDDRAQASWNFALGNMHQDRGRYDKAFSHYEAANARMRKFLEFNPAQFDAHLDAIARLLVPEFFAERAGFGLETEVPVFIFGMPRSGTTLVEQVLASHPFVHGGGEMRLMPRLASELSNGLGLDRSYVEKMPNMSQDNYELHARLVLAGMQEAGPGAVRVTDKLPGNYMHLGLLALMFPRARFVHCRRHPLDVCVSNFIQVFAEGHHYAYSLGHLGHVYSIYHRLMEHWQRTLNISIHEVAYEDMVTDQAGTSRRLVEFCGLEWDERCLKFNEYQRDVSTASQWQVRQPIYNSAVSRWRQYDAHLGELRAALGDLAIPDVAVAEQALT